MNFATFPIASTNVFPAANDVAGGQLMTEFNLRSRESIAVSQKIKYMVGPSYVHCKDDFWVDYLKDGYGNIISSGTLVIAPGRGVINGHFVENLASMTVDMTEANARANNEQIPQLKGKLHLGLRIMYSTEATMAGSLHVGDNADFYEGIQVVILPEAEFKLPIDVPNDLDQVTAHLLLARFYYLNGEITGLENNCPAFDPDKYPDKCQVYEAERIANIENMLSSTFLKKSGLDADKLYTFSGRGTKDDNSDTWCDSTDSLMIWDNNPGARKATNKPALKEAKFDVTTAGKVQLQLPHKQPIVPYTDAATGKILYYQPKTYDLPLADYGMGTAGTVDRNYTNNIKRIHGLLNNLVQRHHLGEMIYYIDTLTNRDEQLPKRVNPNWHVGDYIFVRCDQTIGDNEEEDLEGSAAEWGDGAPSTLYMVCPGKVTEIEYVGYMPGSRCPDGKDLLVDVTGWDEEDFQKNYSYRYYVGDTEKSFSGMELRSLYHADMETDEDRIIETKDDGTIVYREPSVAANTTDKAIYNASFGITDGEPIYGSINQDYCVHRIVTEYTTKEVVVNNVTTVQYTAMIRDYLYKVSKTEGAYLNKTPIMVTGTIPRATTESVGGVVSVNPDDYPDQGYVYVDEATGTMKLVDWALIRNGQLAYQLSQDYTVPEDAKSAEEIQQYLDEYVNQRVAFLDAPSLTGQNVITITIPLTKLEESVASAEINIYGIDSRFNTAVRVKITGTADSRTSVNIFDCEKVIVDPTIGDADALEKPTITITRCNLYYDPVILNNALNVSGLSLWYEKLQETDPTLVVNDMTVTQVESPIYTEGIDYWNALASEDNHYLYALKSVTFSKEADIIGCELLVRTESTANQKVEGNYIIAGKFKLPQGSSLVYPETCLTTPIRICGSFVTAYRIDNPVGFKVLDTQFTAVTPCWAPENGAVDDTGTIAFYQTVKDVVDVVGVPENMEISCWKSGKFLAFQGRAIK